MTKKQRTPDPISRAFRQDYPEFAARAAALGVRISLSRDRRAPSRVYWLDGYRQLTGYDTRSDGSRFTAEDAANNIDKALTEIEEDRALIAPMTVAERFARVMDQMRQMKPQYRMIGEVRMPCGDNAWCFFMADYDGGVRLHEVGQVAKAKAPWVRGEPSAGQVARFCDALEADFRARQSAALTGGKA